MNTNIKRFGLSSLAVAVLSGLIGIQATAQEVSPTQESDEAIEEVVVKVSRLKGTANAVIEERKNQAFVADILSLIHI